MLSSAEAHALWENKAAAFIDVLPQAPRPKNLPKDVVWRDKPRYDIPGSLWLPDTGYGELGAPMRDYFVAGLRKAASGDAAARWCSIVSATAGCPGTPPSARWRSGFATVDWYPDGADGWREAGFPWRRAQPEPRPQ